MSRASPRRIKPPPVHSPANSLPSICTPPLAPSPSVSLVNPGQRLQNPIFIRDHARWAALHDPNHFPAPSTVPRPFPDTAVPPPVRHPCASRTVPLPLDQTAHSTATRSPRVRAVGQGTYHFDSERFRIMNLPRPQIVEQIPRHVRPELPVHQRLVGPHSIQIPAYTDPSISTGFACCGITRNIARQHSQRVAISGLPPRR